MGVRLREAWMWPNNGRVGEPWVPGSAGGDALARAGDVVAAQLKLLLAEHEVRLRSSAIQVLVHGEPATGSEVELTVYDDREVGGETAQVTVPRSVADLSHEQQWWLAFHVLRRACEELQHATGDDDQAPWPAIAAAMVTSGPFQRLTSRWKASPDRRHRARTVSELRVDGQPEAVWIEIARKGEDMAIGRGPVTTSAWARRPPPAPTWQTSATAGVTMLVDRGGRTLEPDDVTATVTQLEAVEPPPHGGLTEEPHIPAVRVSHFSTRDPARPADVEIGHINGRPGLLPREHRRAWLAVPTARLPTLRQWWAASGLASLIVSPVCDTRPPRASSSLDGRDLWVEVPLDPRAATEQEPDEFVLAALQSALDIAARRAKIPPFDLSAAEDDSPG